MSTEQRIEVGYTVKELLARIEGKLDTLTKSLSDKADRAELTVLSDHLHKIEQDGSRTAQDAMHRIETLMGRVADLEAGKMSDDAVKHREDEIAGQGRTIRWMAAGLVIEVVLTLATIVAMFIK